MTAKLVADYNSKIKETTIANLSTQLVIERATTNLLIDWNDKIGNAGNPLAYMAMKSEHTLLTHAVGLHCDYFEGNGKDAIENKIVLVSKRFSPKDDMSEGTHDLGRGGLPTFYTWALLKNVFHWTLLRPFLDIFIVKGTLLWRRGICVCQSFIETRAGQAVASATAFSFRHHFNFSPTHNTESVM